MNRFNLITDDTVDLVIHELDGFSSNGFDGVLLLSGICGMSEAAMDDAVLAA